MEILKLVKKQFQKFGLSEKSLKEVATLVDSSFVEGEEKTEELILERISLYEPIAKTFQSEIERRLSEAKKGTNGKGNGSETEEGEEPHGNEVLVKQLNEVLERLNSMERGQMAKTNNERAITKLKELKISDKEIEALMYGRNFESEEAVNEFVSKQGEIYQDVLKERHNANAGNGFTPMGGQGDYSKKAIEQAVESFNKQF